MGNAVFKAETGRGGLTGWSQLVDSACSVTFFKRLFHFPPLESHSAHIRNCEEFFFAPSCKFASLDSKNHYDPNI